jgi:hypothetical protein
LAVAHGHVQLLQRRIRQNGIVGNDELLRRLESTDAALRTIAEQLGELTESTSRGPSYLDNT